MEKTVIIVLALVGLAAMGAFYTHQTVATSTEEIGVVEEIDQPLNLAEKLLGSKPSEDVSHLLQFPELAEYTYSFAPAPRIEYLIHLTGEKRLVNQEIVQLYDKLQEEMGGWFLLYGRVGEQWTIPRKDLSATLVYDELVVSSVMVDYEGIPVSKDELVRLDQIAQRLAMELDLTLRVEETIEVAAKRADVLANLWQEYDQWIILTLEADPGEPFTGHEIHDAALALGLEWDEDSQNYIWFNNPYLVGDDFLFSVGNLQGADFIPEEMVKEDFVAPGVAFGFYLPISGAPKEVYENMLTAAKYFQKRLGGTIQDIEGRALSDDDLEWVGSVVEDMAQEMDGAGFTPGHNLTLWFYEGMVN